MSLFIFRRDLRIVDNTALLEASRSTNEKIYPIFIFDPQQVTSKNKFKSNNCVQFMIESLKDLYKQTNNKLTFYFGNPPDIIASILKNQHGIKSVYFNKDYSPYAVKRDTKIENECKKIGVECFSFHDLLLNYPGSVLNGSSEPYKIFGSYYSAANRKKINNPSTKKITSFSKLTELKSKQLNISQIDKFYKQNKDLFIPGGRENGLKLLKDIKELKKYNKERDCLTIETSKLSAHNKFGTISIREVYHAAKDKIPSQKEFIKQLHWRDYYHVIAYFYPYVIGGPFYEKYEKIKWNHNKKYWKAWIDGTTGFPIVDAGMRQMNETGYMHNRARLITCSFLVKDLLLNWEDSEKYFAQTLLDYDISVNNGNHQWVAGTGASNMPPFRVFNPWLQSKKYDPNAEYIKEWIPELKDVPAKDIHKWYKTYKDYPDVDYPDPIVDHEEQKKKALKMYKVK